MGEILEARYMNVDFLVEADFDLTPIIEEIKDNVLVLWNESVENSSSFGIESKILDSKSPEKDITAMLFVIEQLPDKLKEMIFNCRKKIFDIGFECGVLDIPIDVELSAETITRISKLKATINIKLYPWVEKPI